MTAQQQNKLNVQFPVCANVGVLFSLEIPPQACEKRIQQQQQQQQQQVYSVLPFCTGVTGVTGIQTRFSP